MRLAVVSDVHANLPALESVAADIAAVGTDLRLCLGDLVGYGAEPSRTIRRTLELADLTVAGNHDVDVVTGVTASGVRSVAKWTLAWTREQLDSGDVEALTELPRVLIEPGRWIAVHGCYLNDLHYTGYVTSTMLEENLRAVEARSEWPRLAFCGHTHLPMCGWLDGRGDVVEPPAVGEVTWPDSAQAVILNPGSVGQPRDGDPRASWMLVDDERRCAEVRRVSYDIDRAVRALEEAGLPAELGRRLKEGR